MKSQLCSCSAQSFCVNTIVGDNTCMRIASTSWLSPVLDQLRVDRDAVDGVQHVDENVVQVGFEQPVFGRPGDGEAGGVQGHRGRVDVGLGDGEVDVVHRLGAAVHPQRVAARQRELRTVRFERRGGPSQRVPQFVAGRDDLAFGDRKTVIFSLVGTRIPMRMATFNILHGSTAHDAEVDLDQLADCVRQLDADVLALQEVDYDQPRSAMADLTAVAAEAMGAVSHRFVAAISGTPGATWMAATGDEQPGAAAYGIALLSTVSGAELAGGAAAADPGTGSRCICPGRAG